MAGTASISWINNSASNTYATWDAATADADIVLTGSNLIASNANGNSGGVRSTIGKTTGKWYWEITITAIANASWGIGIVNASATLAFYPGKDTNGWAWWFSTGDRLTNDTLGTNYATAPVNSDVIGFALDADAATIVLYKNGSNLGTLYSVLTGTMYACVGNNNALFTATANFGATAFAQSVPVGYNSGLYN